MRNIYAALGISPNTLTEMKSIVHPKASLQKNDD